MNDGLSASDVLALTNRDNDNDGNDMWNNPFVYLVWIWAFSAFGGGFGGLGGNGGAAATVANYATQADIQRAFDTNTITNKLDNIGDGICDGFYAQNTNLLQGFNGVQRDLCAGFNSVNGAIADLGYRTQACCCETNRNIDNVRFENAQNTCAITNAIHCEGEQTRALINQNTMQELRDQLQAAQISLQNVAQTQNIINSVRPFPSPAYITCSPYTSPCGTACGCNG